MNYLEKIGEAVAEKIIVKGKMGSAEYTPVDLFALSLETIDALRSELIAQQSKISANSLFNKTNTTNKYQMQIDLLEAVFVTKRDRANEEALRKANRAKKEADLQKLQVARDVKEIETISAMSLEDIDKKIAELSA